MTKLADALLSAFMEESHENNGEDLDEETVKGLVEEAMRDFTEALNEAQPSEIKSPPPRWRKWFLSGKSSD
ncbi:hypothetical protein V6N13_014939 [Hibiscus sabdariffa]